MSSHNLWYKKQKLELIISVNIMQVKSQILDDFAVGYLIERFHHEWYSLLLH